VKQIQGIRNALLDGEADSGHPQRAAGHLLPTGGEEHAGGEGHRGHYRSGFTTLPPVLLQEQPVVVLLLEMNLVPWLLAIDEHGGHKDLHGSGCRSVISYVHRRMELYCSSPALPV
jgi:hypothetical protein